MLMKLGRSKYIKNVYVYVDMYIYVCVCVLVCVWIYIIHIDMNQNDSAVLKLAFFRWGHQIVVKFAKIFNYIQVVSLVFEASTKLESYMLYNLLFEDIFKNNWKKFFATHTLLIFQEIKTDKVVNNCEKELLPISSFLLISVC